MIQTLFSLHGYAHLYHSLLRFYDMPSRRIKEMLYMLNTANLDSCRYYNPERRICESGPVAFSGWLDNPGYRPYRTEVQLHKSLAALKCGINYKVITTSQREAVQTLRCIISNIEYRFYKAYGVEIDDTQTVYSDCIFGLVPKEDEPSVCLMHDWIYLPSA